MAGGADKARRARRSYRPTVETMEALRLLSGAVHSASVLGDAAAPLAPPAYDVSTVSGDAWDAALLQGYYADGGTSTRVDPQEALAGLNQLDRYLARSWYRANLPVQAHDDSTQAVYATMLEHYGRDRFEGMLAEVGRWGVKDVLSRETDEGLTFFRAVDMVKKRAQRERSHQSLDAIDVASSSSADETEAWRNALDEAVDASLSPREADLIQETLQGRTPAEIALRWGVAPKTVSNEKARVLQKLRDLLQARDVA